MTEFDFINNLKLKYDLSFVGDDAAIIPKDETSDLLITSDMLVEAVDFHLDWTTPEVLGHKALAVSLSDIAAMGGTPKWALCSIGVSENIWESDVLERFYAGWQQLASRTGVTLIGGDISRMQNGFAIDSTVIGEVASGRSLRRGGARPGDAIFVSGYLGGAAAGLKLLQSGLRFDDGFPPPVKHLLYRQLQPLPQVTTGILLQTRGLASAAIDISDGLSSDLSHILEAGSVGARVFADQVPIDPAIAAVFPDHRDDLEMALHGGEDFELLITVRPENVSPVSELGFHQIGEITDQAGRLELIGPSGSGPLQPRGYRHF